MNTKDKQNLNLTNSGSGKFARDYDKEPLVLRDYSGFPLILHYLIILIFWITASEFCISCLDDFESGILDFDNTTQTIIKFGFAIVVFLIFNCFNIINSKKNIPIFIIQKLHIMIKILKKPAVKI